MSESPRWERESQEDLRPPASTPEETIEFDMAAAGFVDPGELREPPEYAADESSDDADDPDDPDAAAYAKYAEDASREARLDAVRESLSATRESLSATRESLAGTAGRVGRWFAALDRRPEFDPGVQHDPLAALSRHVSHGAQDPVADPEPIGPQPADPPRTEPGLSPRAEPASDTEHDPGDASDDAAGSRFPTAPLGYNRQAVDRRIAALEAEVERLREAVDPPVSITEEIERLGEQTASILVVAHDKAHETAREAQARAARAVTEAANNAERITAEAQRRLRVLDEETDAVWRERERLLDDVRAVSAALVSLADDASERFPAAPEPSASSGTPAEPVAGRS